MTKPVRNEDGTYENTYFFVCEPCRADDDFDKFESTIKNKEMLVLLNFVCSNEAVEEKFECIGTTLFDGNMNSTDLFTKDRRS